MLFDCLPPRASSVPTGERSDLIANRHPGNIDAIGAARRRHHRLHSRAYRTRATVYARAKCERSIYYSVVLVDAAKCVGNSAIELGPDA